MVLLDPLVHQDQMVLLVTEGFLVCQVLLDLWEAEELLDLREREVLQVLLVKRDPLDSQDLRVPLVLLVLEVRGEKRVLLAKMDHLVWVDLETRVLLDLLVQLVLLDPQACQVHLGSLGLLATLVREEKEVQMDHLV